MRSSTTRLNLDEEQAAYLLQKLDRMLAHKEQVQNRKERRKSAHYFTLKNCVEKLKAELNAPLNRKELRLIQATVEQSIQMLQTMIIPGYKARKESAQSDDIAARYSEYLQNSEKSLERSITIRDIISKKL